MRCPALYSTVTQLQLAAAFATAHQEMVGAKRAAAGGAGRAGVTLRAADGRNPQPLGAAAAVAAASLRPAASLAPTMHACFPATAGLESTGDATASDGCGDAERVKDEEEQPVTASVEREGVEWGLVGKGLLNAGTNQHSNSSVIIQHDSVEQQSTDGLCGRHLEVVPSLVPHDMKALGAAVRATHAEFLRSLNMQALKKHAKAKLPDNAVLVLRRWWEENQDWPYPSVSAAAAQ